DYHCYSTDISANHRGLF
nr:immunoglobulin light chain junction region [Macaca mulatta]